MAKKSKTGVNSLLLSILSVIFFAALVTVCGYLYKKTYGELIRNAVIFLLCFFSVMVSFLMEQKRNQLFYSNGRNIGRFLLFFGIMLGLSCTFPLFSSTAWFFPVCFTALSFFSGPITGILSGILLVSVTCMLSGASFVIFLLYVCVGIFAVIIFSKPSEQYKIFLPVLSTILFLMTVLVAEVLFCIPGITSFESFVIPCINVFMNILLYVVLLKILNVLIINKDRSKLLTIGDQTYKAMICFKEKEPAKYKAALHTAHFAERIAPIINANVLLTKCVSYYSEFYEDNLLYNEERKAFPKSLTKCIDEVHRAPQPVLTNEACAVLISKEIIQEVSESLQNKHKFDIDATVNKVFEQFIKDETFVETTLSLATIKQMKEKFISEKIYFDFLKE